MRLLWRISTLFIGLLACGLASAQNATTSLRGTVTDSTGAVIPGATVKLADPAIGYATTIKSDGRGEYSFQQLTPGNYTVSFEAQGFSEYQVKTVLQVSLPATVNAKMQVGAAGVVVEVQTTDAGVNTTDASMGNVLNNEAVMQLPSEARQPESLLALQPGVLFIGGSDSTESRNGVVSGARADQTNITLDGVDDNDQVFPSAFTGVLKTPLDSLEEFRVTTSNANVDEGRSSGGQVNLQTRSGTNTIHGAVYEYNRSSIGDANDWIYKNSEIQSGLANRPTNLIYNVFGGRIGGPILKDKLFLFANYEGERQRQPNTSSRVVPTTSYRAGNVIYPDVNGNLVTLSKAQIAGMDQNCTTNGTCPQGPGDNPSVLALFNGSYPTPNTILGGDGYNTATYTFATSVPSINNVYLARIDFNPNDNHRFFVRGSFQSLASSFAPYYPGQPASKKDTDNSRGLTGSYTWQIAPNKTNNLRYGYVRQSYASTGVGKGSYVNLRTIDLPEDNTRSSNTLVPMHNIIDDYTYTKGRHTIQVGVNYRHFQYGNNSTGISYDSATANVYWMVNSGIADTGSSFDPVVYGHPDVNPNFTSNYDFAISDIAGLVNEETDHYNYHLSSDGKTGTLLATGAPVALTYRSNEFEWYAQDAFKPVPNMTITLGVRHTIQQTPYEIYGQQVQPTINMHQWFMTRGQQAAMGNSVQPDISFAPSGQARGGKPLYPMAWNNFAPRFAIAYSPNASEGLMHAIFGGAGKSSIRAGFGMYYDHFGQGLVANYSRTGSYSLNTSLTNPASVLTPDTSPRYTGLHNLPGLVGTPTASISYPQTPSDDPYTTGFAITNGLDDGLKTPYSYAMNLSWQRELKGGFQIETAYVGRLGRHLIQSMDFAQPLNLVDPKSGMDYYTAGTILSKQVDAGATTVAAIPYFEDLFPDAAGLDTAGDGAVGNSATQNIYNDVWQYSRGNETAALDDMDIYCYPGCGGKIGRYWPLQYSSLYVTSTNGTSNYNAGQFILKHNATHGFQFDVSYTISKSLDIGSDSESNVDGSGNAYGFILDAWHPRKNYAVSDFDTRQLITADYVLALPFGHGRAFGGSSSKLVDAFLGGWTLAGLIRASSGLPFGLYDGDGWSTNWEWESAMVQTGPIKMRLHQNTNGAPQVFDDPLVARANLRDPYPGEAGQRNHFRGQGYYTWDSGLHKQFSVTEKLKVQMAWEVFNVTNSVRFDAHQIDSGSTDGTQMGVYGATFAGSGGNQMARRMQLSGRIEF
ncbi:Carboxypeptidase regulatory-like domain-containing protein [Bryocella elongata]|uniref:Carboxypeptidase regulatory-like domain-containing protein n=1 Tax=Bryocella elongata TaxID=863522 RepID=A0A1H5Y4D5_9BACT|nr:carboxypeptidase-like regulatory domain-containing protein [Bryocella elongata]SEG18919.1 Carboxypeptidase regulatory-like domain-containing protein [Bryocella elongata]